MKRKKASNLHAELNFISSLELEQSADIIVGLADTYPVTLTEKGHDRIDFEVKFSHGNVTGQLQRWQGTDTRIICSGDVVRVLYTNDQNHDIAPSVVAVGGLTCLILLGVGQVMPAMLGFAGLTIWAAYNKSEASSKEPETILLFRERDAIFQYLIDSFKADGEVAPL